MFYRSLIIVSLFASANAFAGDLSTAERPMLESAPTEDTSAADDTHTAEDDADRGWWCTTHATYDQCPLDEFTTEELELEEADAEARMAEDLDAAAAMERAWWCPIHSAYDTHPIIDAAGW
jgi:hypothetical protein